MGKDGMRCGAAPHLTSPLVGAPASLAAVPRASASRQLSPLAPSAAPMGHPLAAPTARLAPMARANLGARAAPLPPNRASLAP